MAQSGSLSRQVAALAPLESRVPRSSGGVALRRRGAGSSRVSSDEWAGMPPARGSAVIHFTPQARSELGGDEALVFDWHRVAICCACAGEVSLRRAPRRTVEGRRAYRPLPAEGD